jgi:uncharacterized membrane protein
MGSVADIDPAEDSVAVSLGESRWPPAIAVFIFVVLNVSLRLWLPSERAITMPWLLPGVEVLLLAVLLISDPVSTNKQAHRKRRIAIVLVGLLVAAALGATVVLISHLIEGSPQTNSGGRLLAAGALVWIGNIVAFSLVYWIFDSGGPRARAHRERQYPDLVFPQTGTPELVPDGWHPVYVDYLYLGFSTSTAFSPTDVLPYAHWAKLAMGVQSAVSLAVIGLVIARAVNVLA